jgi:EAL domain-containing protein (putative c-di-GMP-specific phosphodiesterase class I)
VARLDADAFAIATHRRTHPSQLQELAVEIMQALEERATIAGRDITLSAVIGIAARGSARDTPETLMLNAEIACARARKERGSVYFAEEMSARLTARRQTAQELLQALVRDEIEPYFQPQIEVATGRVVGFEALARWRQPDRSVLSPYFFMDIAQDARLSQRITNAMLAKALPALADWRAQGLDVPQIGLNVTLRELRDPAFHDRLLFDLERLGLSARDLAIEILESALIENDDDPVLQRVTRLSRSGFRIDLDDFGTGHASLSNLQRLAVDRIKIDRAFIRDLPAKPDLRKVTIAMIHLARSLGITALAEGVETDDERRLIAELGVHQMQGFALGRPMPAGDVPGWLRARTGRAVSAA